MSAAFTPGPWKVKPVHRESNVCGYRLYYPDELRVAFCEVYVADGTARLIAAAPDLYEALGELLKALAADANDEAGSDHRLENAYADARAALAKARGQ